MYYVIDKDALYNRADEEISRVADEAYSEDGISLYDVVVLTERDKSMVKRYMDDAIDLLVRRCFDICKFAPLVNQDETITPRLNFYVPDLDTSMESAIQEEISKYIALYAVGVVLQSRRAAVVPQVTERVQAAMDKAVALLKTRKAPNEQWS